MKSHYQDPTIQAEQCDQTETRHGIWQAQAGHSAKVECKNHFAMLSLLRSGRDHHISLELLEEKKLTASTNTQLGHHAERGGKGYHQLEI